MPTMGRAYGLDGTCRMTDVGGTGSGVVTITDSVGEGGRNRREDVRIVQDALNQVPTEEGGPDPQLNVDGLAFGKTVAAIRRFQKIGCRFKWPDGRVQPGRRTHLELQKHYKPPNPDVVPLIYLHLPDALSWIYAARSALREAEFALQGMPAPARGLQLLNKYFHLDTASTTARLAAVGRMRALYNTMETCIGRSTPMTAPGTGYFQEDRYENRHMAYTWSGAYTMAGPPGGGPPVTGRGDLPYSGVRKDTIYICPRKLNIRSGEFYTMVVIHELAHFCGPPDGSANAVDDYSYRKRPGFFQLNAWQAERTADCYAHFAGEAKLGREAPHS